MALFSQNYNTEAAHEKKRKLFLLARETREGGWNERSS